VQRRFAVPLVCFLGSLGCGDGVGRPIVERDKGAPIAEAGSAAVGGSPGGGWGGRYEGGRDGGGRDAEGARSSGCANVADWAFEDTESELDLFALLNFARQYGVSCTGEGAGESAPAVEMRPELRCAARLHSRDMSDRDFFDHVNPDGEGPEDRMRSAGFTDFRIAAESIARGPAFDGTDPYAAFQELFSAGGNECENLLDPGFDSVGIGRFGDFWTLDFTGP
jgi:hypothetical protein